MNFSWLGLCNYARYNLGLTIFLLTGKVEISDTGPRLRFIQTLIRISSFYAVENIIVKISTVVHVYYSLIKEKKNASK